MAVSDATANVTYAPWDTADARLRLRQQISLGAGAADANGAPVFEPRDVASSPLVSNDKVVATNQLAFLRTASSTGAAVATTATAIGLVPVQQNFHAWSPNNFAVLASTAPASAGLRRDLSLDPTLLGPAYVTWADYTSYMEPPVPAAPSASATPATPTIPPTPSPDYSSTNPVRRRYVMQAPPQSSPGEVARTVAPVLNYFLLSFSIRTVNGATGAGNQMEARARWMFSLWNPYAAALVPEDLRLEVTGLPTVQIENDTPITSFPPVPRPPIPSIDLQFLFGSPALAKPPLNFPPLNIRLPWDSKPLTGGSRIFLWGYLFVMVIELALTKTRSAWAILFFTLIAYGCLFEKRYLLYSIVLVATAMLITPIQDRLLNLTDTKIFWNYGFATNSYEWRQILWESAWNWMSPSNMVFGSGLGSFLKLSPIFFPLSGGAEFGAHNVYLQLLFEEGVIGVASFVWLFAGLLLVIYRDAITEKRAVFIVLALLTQYLVAGYSDNMLDYLSFNWNFWFLCGTAYSVASINHSLEATKSISTTYTRFRIKLHGG